LIASVTGNKADYNLLAKDRFGVPIYQDNHQRIRHQAAVQSVDEMLMNGIILYAGAQQRAKAENNFKLDPAFAHDPMASHEIDGTLNYVREFVRQQIASGASPADLAATRDRLLTRDEKGRSPLTKAYNTSNSLKHLAGRVREATLDGMEDKLLKAWQEGQQAGQADLISHARLIGELHDGNGNLRSLDDFAKRVKDILPTESVVEGETTAIATPIEEKIKALEESGLGALLASA
jgi:hypothetical protein